MNESNSKSWSPELIYIDGLFRKNQALACEDGTIVSAQLAQPDQNFTQLNSRAILPGLVNAHSHAFQRVIRGRTEYRTANTTDSFWTWREMMYSAAARLTAPAVLARLAVAARG